MICLAILAPFTSVTEEETDKITVVYNIPCFRSVVR